MSDGNDASGSTTADLVRRAGRYNPGMNFPVNQPRSTASVVRWVAVVIVLLALLIGSLLPGGMPLMPEGRISLPWGIVVFPGAISPPIKHLLAFGLLAFFLVLALEANWRRAGWVACGLAVMGLVIEVVQIPIPDRTFLWIDAGASAAGALGGVMMGVFARWFVR